MTFFAARRFAGIPSSPSLQAIPSSALRLALCALLMLALMLVGERAFAAGAERAAGKPRTAAGAKGRKRPVRKQAASRRRAAVATPAAKAHQAAAAEPAPSGKPELLARCGYTEASRRHLFSHAIYVQDEQSGATLYERNAEAVAPIASVSKLMMAMVWLDHKHGAMNERLEVTGDDLDTLKNTASRLAPGASLTRADMMHVALMSSENRAAAALSRDYPGGREAFIAAMNAKAQALGMPHTHFVNATGLSPENVSTARELASMVRAANGYQLIRQYSVDRQQTVNIGRGQLQYVNSNRLVRYGQVSASVQKTGFINEAGHNMVMRLMVHGRRPVVVSMLGSDTGNGSRLDGERISRWLNCSLR